MSKVEQIRSEARKIARTGTVNMFSMNAVYELAVAYDCYALADFILEFPKAYGTLILSGELPAELEGSDV